MSPSLKSYVHTSLNRLHVRDLSQKNKNFNSLTRNSVLPSLGTVFTIMHRSQPCPLLHLWLVVTALGAPVPAGTSFTILPVLPPSSFLRRGFNFVFLRKGPRLLQPPRDSNKRTDEPSVDGPPTFMDERITPPYYLTDSEATLQSINKWIGGGVKLSLVRSPDGDVLKAIIVKLQKRVKTGAATLLIKVQVHRGDPLNEEADIRAEMGRLKEENGKTWNTQTDRTTR